MFLASIAVQGVGQVLPRPSTQVATKKSGDSVVNETKERLREKLSEVKSAMPDTLPAIPVDNVGQEVFHADSVGVSYENGKLVLPNVESSYDRAEEVGKKVKDRVPSLSEKDELRRYVPEYKGKDTQGQILQEGQKLKDGQILKDLGQSETQQRLKELQHRSDSVELVVEKVEEVAGQIEDGIPEPQKIYSLKWLQKLYDSLGISKLDSVLSLASSRKEVSKDELLDALGLSFPQGPMKGSPATPGELAELSEVQSLKNEMTPPDLSSMKLPDHELAQLAPIRGFQLPTDSIPLLDSIRRLNSAREKLRLKQDSIEANVRKVLIKRKQALWDRMYVEGILSFLNQYNDLNLWQVSPAIGYRVHDNFSVGVGPNIQVRKEEKRWKVGTGYRAFAKYEIIRQHAYLQLEDVVDPVRTNMEFINHTRHSILAGGGYLLSVSNVLAINFSVLCRVNQRDYSDGKTSPWVIRIGLSSKNSKGVK